MWGPVPAGGCPGAFVTLRSPAAQDGRDWVCPWDTVSVGSWLAGRVAPAPLFCGVAAYTWDRTGAIRGQPEG